jgi:hypothetical protein
VRAAAALQRTAGPPRPPAAEAAACCAAAGGVLGAGRGVVWQRVEEALGVVVLVLREKVLAAGGVGHLDGGLAACVCVCVWCGGVWSWLCGGERGGHG